MLPSNVFGLRLSSPLYSGLAGVIDLPNNNAVLSHFPLGAYTVQASVAQMRTDEDLDVLPGCCAGSKPVLI